MIKITTSHGNQEVFSCRGIQICIDWFRARGHQEITAFVPMFRKQHITRYDVPIIGLYNFFLNKNKNLILYFF